MTLADEFGTGKTLRTSSLPSGEWIAAIGPASVVEIRLTPGTASAGAREPPVTVEVRDLDPETGSRGSPRAFAATREWVALQRVVTDIGVFGFTERGSGQWYCAAWSDVWFCTEDASPARDAEWCDERRVYRRFDEDAAWRVAGAGTSGAADRYEEFVARGGRLLEGGLRGPGSDPRGASWHLRAMHLEDGEGLVALGPAAALEVTPGWDSSPPSHAVLRGRLATLSASAAGPALSWTAVELHGKPGVNFESPTAIGPFEIVLRGPGANGWLATVTTLRSGAFVATTSAPPGSVDPFDPALEYRAWPDDGPWRPARVR